MASGEDPVPFDVNGMKAKILSTEQMEDQGQVILHVSFLPYEQELRREIIRIVYQSDAASGTPKAKTKAKKAKAAKKKAPVGPRKAKKKKADVAAVPQTTSDAADAASSTGR